MSQCLSWALACGLLTFAGAALPACLLPACNDEQCLLADSMHNMQCQQSRFIAAEPVLLTQTYHILKHCYGHTLSVL
jgi:hypothetical protein